MKIATVALTACLLASPVGAQESFNLEAVTCWDVSTLGEDEAAYALLLVYGYAAGKQGQATQSGPTIESAFAKAIAFCDENPDALVHETFQAVDD